MTTSSCRAQSLHLRGGRQGGGGIGVARGDVEVTNRSASPCTLPVPRSVALLDTSGAPLPIRFGAATPQQPALELPPHGSAMLIVDWVNWCRTTPGPLTAAVRLPGASGTVYGPFNGPPDYDFTPGCVARQQPSTLQFVSLALKT